MHIVINCSKYNSMAANKLQKDRYYFLDACFRNNQKRWSLDLLLQTINDWLVSNGMQGISKRTLQDDIKYLVEVEDAPIEKYKIEKANYFKYADTNFSIKETKLSKNDENNIRKAVNILRQLKGLSIADELSDTIQRLEQKVELDGELSSNTLQFEQNIYYTGKEWFADLYEFLLHKKVLKLNYRPFEATENIILQIHPYLLKQYNQRWFLIGWCTEHKNIGTYALDRIIDARVSNEPFFMDKNFDIEVYNKYLIGVTIPKNPLPEELELIFSAKRAKYFLTKPFGEITNTKVLKSGKVKYTLKLIINNELIAAILQFGSDVEVLKPLTLRNSIIEILKKGVTNYEN